MRYLIAISCLILTACATSSQAPDMPRMANLQWYEGVWLSEDGSARQVLRHGFGTFSGTLYFRESDSWALASQGGCRHRNVMMPGRAHDTSFWECRYDVADGFDMGFDTLVQSAYDAPTYRVDGLPAFRSGTIFVNRAVRDGVETVTYEHWTQPDGQHFTYQLWQLDEAGNPEPWFSGGWTRIEDDNT